MIAVHDLIDAATVRRDLANRNFAFGNKVGFRPIWPLQRARAAEKLGIANKQNEQRLAIIDSPLQI